jgi:hypothetical protein
MKLMLLLKLRMRIKIFFSKSRVTTYLIQFV